MDRLTVEDNDFPPPLQPLTPVQHPQELDALIDSLLVPWRRRTRAELRRLRREGLAREREELVQRLQTIAAGIEELFRFETGTLTSKRRTGRVATARHIAYYLCRAAGGSFPLIGRSLSRDHSSVFHGVSLIQRRIARDAGFRLFIRKLEAQIAPPHEWKSAINGYKAEPIRL
jgi:hypothetical protein